MSYFELADFEPLEEDEPAEWPEWIDEGNPVG